MQPTLCSRCKKNVAVIFITRIENGESHNEGLCLRCARELHIKPVDEMMEKLGISDADLDNLTGDVAEMLGSMGMLGGDGAADADPDAADDDTDEDDGKTATFPFLNRLFNQNPPPAQDAAAAAEPPRADGAADKRGAAPRKLKFLNNYCIDLTQRARDGKLDAMVGRVEELEREVAVRARTEPRLERDRQPRAPLHRAQEAVHLFRVLGELRPCALLHHLAHGAAGVEVDFAEAVRHRARRVRDVRLVSAEDLAAERAFAGHRLHQLPRRRGAVGEPGGAHHLGVGEVRPALEAEAAERGVGEAGQRRKNVSHFVSASGRGVSAGSEYGASGSMRAKET